MNEWEKRATDFNLGIILHLRTVFQIDIISICLGKGDTGNGPLSPNMGFGKLFHWQYCMRYNVIKTKNQG